MLLPHDSVVGMVAREIEDWTNKDEIEYPEWALLRAFMPRLATVYSKLQIFRRTQYRKRNLNCTHNVPFSYPGWNEFFLHRGTHWLLR